MWENITVAVITAVVVTGLAESVRAIWRYIDRRNRVAGWSIRALPAVSGFRERFFLVENVGNADALDVHVTIGGDAQFEVNAGVELDVLRPRDTFLVLVSKLGSGSVLIGWKDRQGKDRGPARRALIPE